MMINCIMNAFGLFKTNTCEATVLAVAAFVAGAVAMCLACRLFKSPCGGSGAGKSECCWHQQQKKGEEKPFEKRKPHPAPADGSVEIYVGNLSYEMTEEQLRAEFEKFGTVNSARLVMNRYTGKSKGFGFVQMPNRAEAEKACEALNDTEVKGRKIKCNEAKNLV